MTPKRMPLCLLALAAIALCPACSTAQPGATALPDGAGTPDGASTDTGPLDSGGDPGATADAGQTDAAPADAVPTDTSADAGALPDVASDATIAPVDAATDASLDLVADVAAEVVAPDTAAETVTDSAGDVSDAKPDIGAADAVAETSAEVAPDTTAEITDAFDATVAETAPVDGGPAACKPGELKRCWVECPQTYAAGCISGQTPILIMGTQTCSAGQWGACDVKHQCGEFANGPCQPNSKAPQNYLCTDGVPMTGAHICTKPLGINCTQSYYINWPIYDCPLICKGSDDVCATDGAERDCEVHCGSATGPTIKGKQKCQNVCNGLHWNMCSTGEACK